MKMILGTTRRPDIKFFRSGRIEIMASLARNLQITPGDILDLCEDDGQYYVMAHKTHSRFARHEAQCHPTNGRGNHYRAYSGTLVEAIREACGEEAPTTGIALSAGAPIDHPVHGTLVPLITRKYTIL